MKQTQSLFNTSITPACEYCIFAKDTENKEFVECSKSGRVSAYYRCRKFHYSPVRRVPKRMPNLPEMDPENFKLD